MGVFSLTSALREGCRVVLARQRFQTAWTVVFTMLISLAAICSLTMLTDARGSSIDDLNLRNRVEQTERFSDKIENPHEFSCDECHEISGNSRFLEYIVSDDTIELCLGCHSPTHLHPVGVPATSNYEELSKIYVPLGKGKFSGKVVCLSCHYVHADKYKRHILRGDHEVKSKRQEYLCKPCHSGELVARSPHNPEGQSCKFCHTTIPEDEQKLEAVLNQNVQASCNFCHGALDNAHFLSVNPFVDLDENWDFKEMGIPLLNGRFSCISCHDPHAYENRKIKMLRESYLTLAASSAHVNPHWKQVMCISCHDGEPEPDEARLRFDGDINKLCDRCHNGKFARKDIHPVGKEPTDNVEIPDDMPLRDGKVTCSTCHDSSMQEGSGTRSSLRDNNPKFLRGGFNVRNEYCFRCHLLEAYGMLNPHKQTDEWGEIIDQKCLFCHTVQPNVKVIGIAHVRFSSDSLDDYCTCCHGEDMFFDNHPRGPHLVEPSEIIFEAIETSVERIGVELRL